MLAKLERCSQILAKHSHVFVLNEREKNRFQKERSMRMCYLKLSSKRSQINIDIYSRSNSSYLSNRMVYHSDIALYSLLINSIHIQVVNSLEHETFFNAKCTRVTRRTCMHITTLNNHTCMASQRICMYSTEKTSLIKAPKCLINLVLNHLPFYVSQTIQ